MSDPEVTRWTQQQPYDTTFKGLIDDQPLPMLSFFLGKRVIEAQELHESLLKQDTVQPALRVDAPYLAKDEDWQRTGSYVAHVEFETRPNAEVPRRLWEYAGMLYRKHTLPILQAVVCPFVCANVPISPLSIPFKGEEVTKHHYRVMALWQHPVEELPRSKTDRVICLAPYHEGSHCRAIDPCFRADESLVSRTRTSVSSSSIVV